MNKLANTYLDAVDSLLAFHLEHVQEPILDDWTMIVSNLAAAVREINQEDKTPRYPNYSPCELNPEELAQRESLFSKSKPLTLYDLRRQVDEEILLRLAVPTSDAIPVCPFTIGDFEIRRWK
jgi:hypothetical protein